MTSLLDRKDFDRYGKLDQWIFPLDSIRFRYEVLPYGYLVQDLANQKDIYFLRNFKELEELIKEKERKRDAI